MVNYSVTLNPKNVTRAKERIKPSGGKLSPVIDMLLEKWLDEEDSDEEVEEVEEDGRSR